MNIYKELRARLQQEYDQGSTDLEIATRLGCSHQQINHLRNGRRTFSKMRLETLLRLFPGIRISLDGERLHGGVQTVNGNGNNVLPNKKKAHSRGGSCAPLGCRKGKEEEKTLRRAGES